MANFFADIKNTLLGVKNQVRGLRKDIEDLRRQRETIATAPAAREDVLAFVQRWVARQSAGHVARMREVLKNGISNPNDLNFPNFFGEMTVSDGPYRNGTSDGAFCLFFGPAVLDAMSKAIERMPWPEPGPGLPMKERAKALAKLDAQITELVDRERELVADARAAGILLDLE